MCRDRCGFFGCLLENVQKPGLNKGNIKVAEQDKVLDTLSYRKAEAAVRKQYKEL
jgi:hypothetical protein